LPQILWWNCSSWTRI